MNEVRVRDAINEAIAEALRRIVSNANINGDEFVRVIDIERVIEEMGFS